MQFGIILVYLVTQNEGKRYKRIRDYRKILPAGQIVYKYDNGSVMYSYAFTKI